jgi:hypothetical protein
VRVETVTLYSSVFFCFFGEISPTGKDYFFENFQNVRHISEKKKKKKGRIRQI